ncbi:MAG: HU family DNA-binding protein [Prevotellaceae bacterium]|jgi:DNA-binding protein HU-beta|nr:HU family DNA-binding protein [Prevotellaceae bacterium]
MNNKELISAIAAKTGLPQPDAAGLLETTVSILRSLIAADNAVSIQGFGTLDLRKREERISVHPSTQVRTLIPPKLVVGFKQSPLLKNKINNIES